jgi:phosphonate transport system substrate-binding protein
MPDLPPRLCRTIVEQAWRAKSVFSQFQIAPPVRNGQFWRQEHAMPIRPAVAGLLFLLCALPTKADWRETIGSFRVGFVAASIRGDAIAGMEPFRLTLSEGLGVDVELFAARDYAALVDALGASRIEYAILSGGAHALAEILCSCIEPLVVARDGDGAWGIRQVLVAATDQPTSPALFRGKRIGAIRSPAFGGFEVALDGLRAAGLDLAANAATLELFDSGASMLQALAESRVDAAIGWIAGAEGPEAGSPARGTLAEMTKLGIDATRYRIVWQSVAMPNRLHSVRRNLPAEAKTKLREILPAMFENDPVAYDSVEPDHGGGFVAARNAQIEPLVGIMRRLRGRDEESGN